MSKHDLASNLNYKPDCLVSAIHCTLEAFQLAWLTDKICHTHFFLADHLFEFPIQKQLSQHLVYYYINVEANIEACILANNGSIGNIVSRKPRPDYFLIMKGDENQEEFEEWTKQLGQNSSIAMAYIMDENDTANLKWLQWLQI